LDGQIVLVYEIPSVWTPQFAANALFQNGRIALHPTPDRNVIYGEPALRHDFLPDRDSSVSTANTIERKEG
jgi:hypothetical protein